MAVLPSGAPDKVMLAVSVHEWIIVIGGAYYISKARIVFAFWLLSLSFLQQHYLCQQHNYVD